MARRWLAVAIAGLVLGAVSIPARAQRAADTLRVAWQQEVTRLDPYADPSIGSFVLAHEVFDTLVYRDPKTFAIEPLLATAWAWVDPKTLTFTLRQGVRWQDGSPFTAADVAGTINMIVHDPALASSPLYDWLAGAEVVDATHVRVWLSRVEPAALDYFAMQVWIMPAAKRAAMGPELFARKPIGTGPYKVSSIDGLGDVSLDRFDGYFKGSPKGMPAIAHLRFRAVPDPTSELAALLSGNADWIWHFDPSHMGAIRRQPGLVGIESPSLRIAYLSLDAAGRSGPRNPMTDPRVREAIAAAIDRKALALAFGGSPTLALVAPCAPVQFGCDQKAAINVPYDPARARTLLKEAGYPNGLSLQITTYERSSWADSVQSYLRAVGIDAEMIRLPRGEVALRAIEGQNRAEFGDWASYAINDVSAILPHFFGFTPADYTRDPKLRDLLKQAGATLDADRRLADYADAIRIITKNTDWLPLWQITVPYAFTRDLEFTPDPDGVPRFFLARWRGPGDRESAGSGQ